MKLLRNTKKNKRGAALVEYGLLIAGVALICAAAISVFGNKTNDLLGTVAAVLPGNNANTSGTIVSGQVIKTTGGSGEDIQIDWEQVTTVDNTTDNLFGDGAGALINDTQE